MADREGWISSRSGPLFYCSPLQKHHLSLIFRLNLLIHFCELISA